MKRDLQTGLTSRILTEAVGSGFNGRPANMTLPKEMMNHCLFGIQEHISEKTNQNTDILVRKMYYKLATAK